MTVETFLMEEIEISYYRFITDPIFPSYKVLLPQARKVFILLPDVDEKGVSLLELEFTASFTAA